MSTYVGNIVSALATCFEGLSVTFSHFFRAPYTVQYPDRIPMPVQNTLPYRYRGLLDVDLEICTGCLACERACPIECIAILATKDKETKSILLDHFYIDLAKCMYCGLCSEPCPTGAIHHTREFEGADYSLESLVRDYVGAEPVTAYKPKKSGEDDPAILPVLERGLRYVGEFAQPAAPQKAKPANKAKPADKPKPAAADKRAEKAQPAGEAKPAEKTERAEKAQPAAADKPADEEAK